MPTLYKASITTNIGPTIKSIQKGYSAGDSSGTINITIAQVVPEKCVARCMGGTGSNANTSSSTACPLVYALSATTLTVAGCRFYSTAYYGVGFWWEVIEYE